MSFTHWLSDKLRPLPVKTSSFPHEFLPAFEALENRRLFSTLMVVNILDSGAGSLRADIAAAHGGDTIAFAPNLAGQTITLTKVELLINKNLTIAGPGAGGLTVSGNHASRVFEVAKGMQMGITGLTISNGLANGANGGGILNSGTLTVSGTVLSGNSTMLQWKGNNPLGGSGGGIYNSGALTLSNSSLLHSNGSAIYNTSAGTVNVRGSTLSANSTGGGGAGIFNYGGTVVVTASVLSDNSGWQGAGIDSDGTLTVISSTLSGNFSSGGGGGGIANMGTGIATVTGSTVTGNSCSNNGGGIFDQGTLMLSDSTLSGNSAGNDGGGLWVGFYATATVSGTTVTGNSAAQGGGIWNWHNTVTLENFSNITGNTAPIGLGADVYNLGIVHLDGTSSIGVLDGTLAVPI